MKKNLGIAVMNFFGTAGLIALLELFVARFNTATFTQIFTRPAHLAFVAVFGLILGAAAFVRPANSKAVAA